MDAKQRKNMLKEWHALMKLHGAKPLEDDYDKKHNRYALKWKGHTLHVAFEVDRHGAAIHSRWETGDPALRTAYIKAGGMFAESTPESTAAWDAYRKSVDAEHAAIKSAGLPYHNPYSLKWNHYGQSELVAEFARMIERRLQS